MFQPYQSKISQFMYRNSILLKHYGIMKLYHLKSAWRHLRVRHLRILNRQISHVLTFSWIAESRLG